MAWSEQCKVAFKVGARKIMHDQLKKVTPTLRELSKQSDIPYKTLRNWWYENEKCPENGTLPTTNGNNKENNTKEESLLCIECHESTKIPGRNLCSSCQNKKARKAKLKYLHSLTGQVKSISETMKREGTAELKWKGKIRKSEYEQFINTLIETIQVWEEISK